MFYGIYHYLFTTKEDSLFRSFRGQVRKNEEMFMGLVTRAIHTELAYKLSTYWFSSILTIWLPSWFSSRNLQWWWYQSLLKRKKWSNFLTQRHAWVLVGNDWYSLPAKYLKNSFFQVSDAESISNWFDTIKEQYQLAFADYWSYCILWQCSSCTKQFPDWSRLCYKTICKHRWRVFISNH